VLDNEFWQYITSNGKRHGTMEVSPATAQRIIDTAGDQRHVIKGQVARYVRLMREGRWLDDAGGDLLFDAEGRHRGGQHRLLAQVESGVAVSYKVRWDQTEDEIAADNEGGTPWSAADIAGGGLPNAKVRQGITTMLLAIDHYDGEIGARPQFKPGKLDVARYVNDPRVVRAGEIGTSIRNTIGANPSATGALYAVAVNSGRGDPCSFFEQLRGGAGMDRNDPALTLRNMLIGVSFKNLAQKQWQTAYVTARAWNYHVNELQVEKLQRYTPPTNNPVRPLGWKPFFPAAYTAGIAADKAGDEQAA
jgi:hypothetical protein